MKITRRIFFSVLFCLLVIRPACTQTPANQKFLVYVGTYTDKTESKGIYAFDFDSSTGKLSPRGLAAETPNPSWVAIHPNGKWVFAANESGKQSTISAFSIDAQTAKLTFLNQLPAQGEDPCYLSFDKTGNYLFVANYTSGTVTVFPILPDGKLGQPTSVVKDAGPLGPNKERQEGPHAHWIQSLQDSSVWVADLGLDKVLKFSFDPKNGKLSSTVGRHDLSALLPAGTGPRHVAFSKDGSQMFVLGELDSMVTELKLTHTDELSPTPFQRISALPEGYKGRNEAAEIALHPSGKFLYTSNRGHDSIAVFSLDLNTGLLYLVTTTPTGGKEPRHFALDPTGQFLLAENQNSNSIVVFRINPATGALTQVSETDNIPSPVCLVFVPTL